MQKNSKRNKRRIKEVTKKLSVSLRDYQEIARTKFFNANKRGTFLFATGTGKTEIAIGIIEKYLDEQKDGKVLFLVPRITLVEQTVERMKNYGVQVGSYYSLKKELDFPVIVSTYQSISNALDLIEDFTFVIFDEAHTASDYADKFRQIMLASKRLHLLCLTATIDTENYERYGTILHSCPVLGEINLNEAINKGYVSDVKIEDHSVFLSPESQQTYNQYSDNIKNLSDILGTSNPRDIQMMLKRGVREAGAWFKNVQARKLLMEYNEEKVNKVCELIKGFNNEQTIIFCERTQTLELIKEKLGDCFEFITAKTGKKKRKEILENFGITFNVIGTVHTLDLGYDVPNIRHGIIVASNKNETTIVQRIGRVVRKAEGKTLSKIYVVYAKGTHEHDLYNKIKEAVENG